MNASEKRSPFVGNGHRDPASNGNSRYIFSKHGGDLRIKGQSNVPTNFSPT